MTMSDLLFSDTVVSFRDSSAAVDGCGFAGSKQRVEFTVASRSVVSIRVWNSLFWKNSSGLWVALGSTKFRVVFILTSKAQHSGISL